MKICFCVDTLESGGAERVASILANEFATKGHYVEMVMISEDRPESFYKLNSGVKLVPLFADSKLNKRNFFNKIKLLKRHILLTKPEVIISFLPNVNICTYFAIKKIKWAKHIVSERNNPLADPQSKIKRRFKEHAFVKSNGIVCQTTQALNYYQGKTNVIKTVIPNPISYEALLSDKTLHNFNNNLISVGRLEKQKNFQLLIHAFCFFNKNHPESLLKIYGTGSEEKNLRTLRDELALNDKVIFCGNSSTWIEDNLNSSLFISSSLYEGMPNALMESLFNGIPCIATKCPIGGSEDLITHMTNGLLCENNDLNDLISKMEMLYGNGELTTRFQDYNLELRKKYLPNSIADMWLKFIYKVVNN